MDTDALVSTRRPSRTVSLVVSAALVLAWGAIRLLVFDTIIFPLTYALPLLVCVWTRDRVALWSMAAIFVVFHAVKLFWLLPPGVLSFEELRANFGATMANIGVGAVAVHLILALRNRLEGALDDVRVQADELRAQAEELAQQNEELAAQAEEVSYQGEELAAQNVELQSQAEEIAGLNTALERRERLLEGLLDMARLSPTESVALEHIGRAGLELFGGELAAIAVFEQSVHGPVRRALVAATPDALDPELLGGDAFAAIIAAQCRPAAIDDLTLRPDLLPAASPARAVLGAPIGLGDHVSGALVVYSVTSRSWGDEEFQLADWLSTQCARVLLALRLQAELREADRRKGEFLATLSHELRNPLAPMRYALELLEVGRDGDGRALPVLKRQFQQLVRLVDDLLDATRLTSNKIQVRRARIDLAAVVRHAVDGSRPDIEAAGHLLSLALPVDALWVYADSERLAQVVTNLLNNAIRYTPAGGRLEVGLTTTPKQALISVADNGMGLAGGDLERVFEMFTQVSGPGNSGLGIGLALVRGIVELHGGHVEAHSDGPGRGTEFRVTLPLPASSVEDGDPLSSTSGADGEPRRVLVVDDNADAATLLSVLLEAHGHQVRVAHDAEDALMTQASFAADVALLDIGLPDIDGYDLARQLRASATRPLRLIAVTGWGQDGDRERARAAGFDGHLTKPAQLDTLLAVLSVPSRNDADNI